MVEESVVAAPGGGHISISAREEILARVRRALADQAGAEPSPATPRDYITDLDLDPEQLVALFCQRAADYQATVDRVPAEQLAAFVSRRLAERGIGSIVAPPDARISVLPDGVDKIIDDGQLTPAELDHIDGAFTGSAVAIALTGTIILDATIGQGRRIITLIPDYHMCLVEAADVVGTLAQAVRLIDPRRPTTWISGPSATSDIELDRVEGVHGPRTLDIVVIDRS